MTILSRSAYGEVLGGGVRNPEKDFLSLIGDEEHHRLRLRRYRENMQAWKGFHWSAKLGSDPRSGRGAFSWDSQSGPLVHVNFIRQLANKIANSLFKRSFDIVLGEGDTAVRLQDVKRRLDDVWEWNGRERKGTLLGQSGSVWGDVFARVSRDKTMRNGEGGTRLDVLPPQYCFPEFDPVDHSRMLSCLVIWPTRGGGDMIRTLAEKLRTSGDEGVEEEVLESLADIRRSTGNARRLQNTEIRGEWIFPDRVFELHGLRVVRDRPNPLGMINVVHWPNTPVVGEPWGIADITDAVELQREFIEKATDISDIIGYHASPVTCVTGADIDELERGPNKVWGLPSGASAFNLELTSDLGASLNFLALVKEAMHEVTGVPLGALGGSEGTATEFGVAMAMQMAPLLELLAVKAGTYGEGMRKINELILRSEAIRDGAFSKTLTSVTDTATRYDSEIVFFPPLPRDEQVQLETAGRKLELGLSTRERELQELGVRDITLAREIVEAAKKEREVDLQMELGAEGFEVGGGPQGQGPNSPNRRVAGQKVSDAAEQKRNSAAE